MVSVDKAGRLAEQLTSLKDEALTGEELELVGGCEGGDTSCFERIKGEYAKKKDDKKYTKPDIGCHIVNEMPTVVL